jgi:hypothetical protein
MVDNIPKLVFFPITRKDQAICEVRGGNNNDLVIYINIGHCCNKCSKICYRKKKKCCPDCLSGIGGGCLQCGGEEIDTDELEGLSIYEIKKIIKEREPQIIREFTIHDNGEMVPVPKQGGTEHGFIFGSTGSGKSVFCCKYAEQYQKIYDNPIYLISNINEDVEVDKIKDLIRIPIEDVMTDKITPEAIHDCLIIFDDVDVIPDKNISLKVEKLRDQLLTTGRHFGISCLITSHLGSNFQHTKVPINESAFVVVFPKGGNWSQIDRILHNYSGLTRQQEDDIRRLPSRWVMIHKCYPTYVIYEKGCYLI